LGVIKKEQAGISGTVIELLEKGRNSDEGELQSINGKEYFGSLRF
jgi:hypothetical protein